MRTVMAAAGASILLAACAGAPAASPELVEQAAEAAAEGAPEAKSLAAQIEVVEKAWGAALVRRDRAELERLLAPDFAGELMGRMATRAEWLADLDRLRVRSYRVRVNDVALKGDMAVAKVEGAWTVARGGAPTRETFRLEDTWVRQDGAWRVTRRVRLDPPPPGR